MKKILFPALMALAIGGFSTSCTDDPEYDDLETIMVADAHLSYDSDGIWADNDKAGFLNIDDYEFSHFANDGYITGFTASKSTDTGYYTPMYLHPYSCISGGGINGAGSQYLVGYWDSYNENDGFDDRICRVFAEDGDTFEPQSVMVNNTTYMYYSLINGSDFSKKFETGDWVTLTAHGVHQDGSESEAVFYLANIISNDVESGIITKWTEFDLSGLGICTGIYFTIESSDTGAYGMNTPAYFCMDKLMLKD